MEKDKGTTRGGNTLVKVAVWSLLLAAGRLLKFCLFYTKNKKKNRVLILHACIHQQSTHLYPCSLITYLG